MAWWQDYTRTKPIRVEGGIKARSKRGPIGESWWARRWQEALSSLMDSGRLSRGRTYARKGQVRWIEIDDALVRAEVQGSRRRPYEVEIEVEPLDDDAWSAVVDVLAGRAAFAAGLLAGEVPEEIEDAFAAADTSLFPAASGDLSTTCSCPDWANPCKHIAAVYVLLGEAFDDDPFLLLRLRGRHREALLDALRARRSGAAADDDGDGDGADGGGASEAAAAAAGTADAANEKSRAALERERPPKAEAAPLPDDPDTFWRLAEPLDGLDLRPQPAEVEAALLRRLGQPGWCEADVRSVLGPVYRAVGTRAATRVVGQRR